MTLVEDVKVRLRTKTFGQYMEHLDEVDSTNKYALRQVDTNPHGSLFIADYQTAGLGRLNRSWFSPKDSGLYCSILLKPKIMPHNFSMLTILSGVATVTCLRDLTQKAIELKWPNDIYYQGKKLGGILCESLIQGSTLKAAVIGIGLNLDWQHVSVPTELKIGITTLNQIAEQELSRSDILPPLLLKLEQTFEALIKGETEDLIAKANEWHYLNEKIVKAEIDGDEIQGRVEKIGERGRLVIQTETGDWTEINVGDVNLVRDI